MHHLVGIKQSVYCVAVCGAELLLSESTEKIRAKSSN